MTRLREGAGVGCCTAEPPSSTKLGEFLDCSEVGGQQILYEMKKTTQKSCFRLVGLRAQMSTCIPRHEAVVIRKCCGEHRQVPSHTN